MILFQNYRMKQSVSCGFKSTEDLRWSDWGWNFAYGMVKDKMMELVEVVNGQELTSPP